MAINSVLVPYQSSASSKNKDLAAEKILQAFSISKEEEKGNLTCFQKKWSQSYKLVFGTMEKRGRLGILSMLYPTNSVFPFVSSSELWAEFTMANWNVFADGETGTERLETVVETAPLAPKTDHRKGNGPWKRFKPSTLQVCQTTKAAHFSSIAVMGHRVPCVFVHRLLHAWTGRHWNTQDFEISREAPGVHQSPWSNPVFFF